jgi:GTP pyrophosphokinase
MIMVEPTGEGERHASGIASCLRRAQSPEQQYQVASHLASEAANHQRALANIYAELMIAARCVDPRVQLSGRIKSVDSILGKMSVTGAVVHQILDIIGIRAIFQHTRDCYRLVNRIHGEFEVLEQEYDDYIALPKPNGYRSIHTTIVSSRGFPVEFQIRTHAMHVLSERGSASHMQYKKDRVPWLLVRSVPALPVRPDSLGAFVIGHPDPRHPRSTTP